MSRRALVLSSAAVALLAVACVPAKRSEPQLRTAIFACTGGAQTWTVPAGVTQAYFEAYGAQGGAGAGTTSSPGGKGGGATATIAVTPGESIQVDVGCAGKNGSGTTGGGGGFGGGGAGG